MSSFLQPHTDNKNKRKVKLDLLNYATRSDLTSKTGFCTSEFAKNFDLGSLKADIYKSDIGSFEAELADLSKLIKVVERLGRYQDY